MTSGDRGPSETGTHGPAAGGPWWLMDALFAGLPSVRALLVADGRRRAGLLFEWVEAWCDSGHVLTRAQYVDFVRAAFPYYAQVPDDELFARAWELCPDDPTHGVEGLLTLEVE